MIQSIRSVQHHFPSIVTKSSNQTFNLSSTAILTCHIRDLGHHHVTWFKLNSLNTLVYPLTVGEELFTQDQRYSISSYSTSSRDSFWSLEIYQLTLSDEGTYLCKITNRRASVSVSIHLHIQIPMHLSPSYLYVQPGSSVKLNCTIRIDNQTRSTTTTPMLHWYFLSPRFNHSQPEDIFIRKRMNNDSFISYLIIQHAQTYHSGIWTCAYKRQRRTARLIVDQGLFSFHSVNEERERLTSFRCFSTARN